MARTNSRTDTASLTAGRRPLVQQVLAEERLHRLVEELKGATAEQAAAALRAAGPAAIPPLLDALQRRDAELRCQAHRLL